MIRILFFARLREQLDSAGLELDYSPELSCVAALREQLALERGDDWAQALGARNVLVAVNQVMVEDDAALADGDEVAFFPPVTGG